MLPFPLSCDYIGRCKKWSRSTLGACLSPYSTVTQLFYSFIAMTALKRLLFRRRVWGDGAPKKGEGEVWSWWTEVAEQRARGLGSLAAEVSLAGFVVSHSYPGCATHGGSMNNHEVYSAPFSRSETSRSHVYGWREEGRIQYSSRCILAQCFRSSPPLRVRSNIPFKVRELKTSPCVSLSSHALSLHCNISSESSQNQLPSTAYLHSLRLHLVSDWRAQNFVPLLGSLVPQRPQQIIWSVQLLTDYSVTIMY